MRISIIISSSSWKVFSWKVSVSYDLVGPGGGHYPHPRPPLCWREAVCPILLLAWRPSLCSCTALGTHGRPAASFVHRTPEETYPAHTKTTGAWWDACRGPSHFPACLSANHSTTNKQTHTRGKKKGSSLVTPRLAT